MGNARNPYEAFRGHKLSLTDYLAIDRTILANDRTLLSYARTSPAMLAVGGSLFKFFESKVIWSLGGAFMIGSLIVAAVGSIRYRRMKRYLDAALRHTTEPSGG